MVGAAGFDQGHRPIADGTAAERSRSQSWFPAVKRMLGISDSAIMVRGHDDLMVFRSKCCNPIPGDDIVGYVTRGRGIAVHSKAVPNVQKLLYEAERRIPVEWANPPNRLSRCGCAYSPRTARHAGGHYCGRQ